MASTSNRSRNKRQSKYSGDIRVIGGQWRRRRLPVADVAGLRPTGDRVRETLFNWLQPHIAGTHCLDLFAGTGALGIEALSRFATSVVFVEPNRKACTYLQESLQRLIAGSNQGPVTSGRESRVLNTTAEAFLCENRLRYDLVFLDPPFDAALQWSTLDALVPAHLAADALVYIESPAEQTVPTIWPPGCTIHREQRFGDIVARLVAYSDL